MHQRSKPTESEEMLMRPPINRSMRVLDRAFFKKTIPLAAARVLNNQHISLVRKELSSNGDLAFENLSRVHSVLPDPQADLAKQGRRCILLSDHIKTNDTSTWSKTVQKFHDEDKISLFQTELHLDYDSWDYQDIIRSILPEDLDEIPSGFAIVGHIAHLNLREPVHPYKEIIAQVILDKNPVIRTVINKVDDVGAEDPFRTFKYEVLAGPDDMNVLITEGDCVFKFNYADVYWNSRLQTEHLHMVKSFQPGDAVCDVMAGVGPFAIPAGKSKVFCWANDLNPHSYESLLDATTRNKVSNYVRAFNEDGHAFIRKAAADLWRTKHEVETRKPAPRGSQKPPQITRVVQPRTFTHYVMNLPASAMEFTPDFVGLYSGIEATEACPAPTPDTAPLPFIHVYTFSAKTDDNVAGTQDVCERISKHLGMEMKAGDGVTEGQVMVRDVRDVAPKKRMFCATFRLPHEVAWRRV